MLLGGSSDKYGNRLDGIDKVKISNLLSMLDRNVQTFITTTDLKNVSKKIIKDAKKIKVYDGILEEE